MNRIDQCFTTLQQQQRTALIPFITAGDPDPSVTVPLMHGLVKAGANLIELGVPFSDPMADGPVIQKASERALAAGVNLSSVFAMVRTFREQDTTTPVVLMGYLNPVELMGYAQFAEVAKDAGVDGLLTVDLPPEEAKPLATDLREQGLEPIFLLAPTSTEERIKLICEQAGGYLYYVSLKGVTGSNTLDVDAVAQKLKQLRQYTDLPIGVGFGIKDAQTAAQVAQISDAVVVGSALVKQVESVPAAELATVLPAFLTELRAAMDNAVITALA